MSIRIEERNLESYLSAGEMPLPTIYFVLSLLFCLLGIIWISLIRKTEKVVRIHYLMAAFVMVKALALFFHSVSIDLTGYYCHFELIEYDVSAG